MKDNISKAGVFLFGLGVVLVPTFLVMNGVDKIIKNENKANKIKNILAISGVIGGIIIGSKQVKKYELKKQTNK